MISQPIQVIAHRLALAMGVWDVDALLDEMPASVFAKWVAYYGIEPWGYHADNLRTAKACKVIADYSPIAKRHNHSESEFLPKPLIERPISVAVKAAQIFGIPFGKEET